ncbi:MAG: zinc ribbon domain-containing protein [Frisingicoccus sp.]
MWEAVIEKSVFERAQQILAEHWKDTLQIWAENPDKEHAANGPFLGRIYCENCGRKLARTNIGAKGNPYFRYYCPVTKISKQKKCVASVGEKVIMEAAVTALHYQIGLAVDFRKRYGEAFYKELEKESKQQIVKKRDAYEKYNRKLSQLFEHYADGILDKAEYLEIKETYVKNNRKHTRKWQKLKIIIRNFWTD